MLADRYGLPVSTTSEAARDAYVAGADCLLSATAGWQEHLGRAIEADPAFALAHVAFARGCFLDADVKPAREAAARSRELAKAATPREQSHVNAIALPIEGKPVDALAATHQHLAQWPRDAMVLAPATGVFGLIGFSGRQEREEELYRFLSGLAPHYGDDWWFPCVHAFAACETGRLDEAWRMIEPSMAANPRNAHGAHIRVHVLHEMGEMARAMDYLESWMPGFDRRGLLHCHLSWHVALTALSLGKVERAWEAYRAGVHPGGSWGPPINVVSDAAAFLWRAELAGERAPADAVARGARLRAEVLSQGRPRVRRCPRRGRLHRRRRLRGARAADGRAARAARGGQGTGGQRRADDRRRLRRLREGRLERRDPVLRGRAAGNGAHRRQPRAARSRRVHAHRRATSRPDGRRMRVRSSRGAPTGGRPSRSPASRRPDRTMPAARKPRRRTSLAPRKEKRGLDAAEIALATDAPEIAALAAEVRAAGGAPLGAYREPLSGRAAAARGAAARRGRSRRRSSAISRRRTRSDSRRRSTRPARSSIR